MPFGVDDLLFTYDTIMNPAVLAGSTKSYLTDLLPPVKLGPDAIRLIISQ